MIAGTRTIIVRAEVQQQLQSYSRNEPQVCADGLVRAMDGATKISLRQCEALAELHRQIRPASSVETGLAYGFSTIAILDAMMAGSYGHHTAIDPAQRTYWHGVAVAAIERLGLQERFDWQEDYSDRAFIRMRDENTRSQFIFLDGLHSFEGIATDFHLANAILDIGGLLVFNYLWMPVGRSMRSFIANNFGNYREFPSGHDSMFAFRKVAEDSRRWDHFVPFDGTGKPKKKGAFAKLFGK